jgi:hypothetical protein
MLILKNHPDFPVKFRYWVVGYAFDRMTLITCWYEYVQSFDSNQIINFAA